VGRNPRIVQLCRRAYHRTDRRQEALALLGQSFVDHGERRSPSAWLLSGRYICRGRDSARAGGGGDLRWEARICPPPNSGSAGGPGAFQKERARCPKEARSRSGASRLSRRKRPARLVISVYRPLKGLALAAVWHARPAMPRTRGNVSRCRLGTGAAARGMGGDGGVSACRVSSHGPTVTRPARLNAAHAAPSSGV
jgi:hypothetical protein